jgi:uncharacterized membrane protein
MEYTTELTEMVPQPATMDVTPTKVTLAAPEDVATSLTVSEVGTFEDLQNVELRLASNLTQTNGSSSLDQNHVNFENQGITVESGESKQATVTIEVPVGTATGTYEGTIEATASSPSGTITESAPLTVEVESEGGQPGTVSRSVSATSVNPGDEVMVTVKAYSASTSVTINESFSPQFGTASIDSVSYDSGQTIIREANPEGLVVTVNELSSGDAVTVEYTVTIPENITGSGVFTIGGEFASDIRIDIGTDEITVTDGEFEGPVADYNLDNDDDIDITELGQAAADYANGEISIVELGKVASAYANS